MKDSLLIAKLKSLFKEHTAYTEYFEEFMIELEEKKKDLASKVGDKNFGQIVEDMALEFYVLKFNYQTDIDILVDKMITYVNAAKLESLEDFIPEGVINLLKKNTDKAIQPRFFMLKGKPTEVQEGYVEALRESLKEQGNLPKLIENLKK